jgi:hypothetical protein
MLDTLCSYLLVEPVLAGKKLLTVQSPLYRQEDGVEGGGALHAVLLVNFFSRAARPPLFTRGGARKAKFFLGGAGEPFLFRGPPLWRLKF